MINWEIALSIIFIICFITIVIIAMRAPCESTSLYDKNRKYNYQTKIDPFWFMIYTLYPKENKNDL